MTQSRLEETESAFQSKVIALAKTLGLSCYHTHDSRRSVKGFPDLVIVGPRGVLWRELKTTKGRVSPEQTDWLARINNAGQDADVWRPTDWPEPIHAQLRSIR